jgi:phosphoglycolate phosphatase
VGNVSTVSKPASTEPIVILFDIDGTLIVTGGAGAASWRLAFDEIYGIPADIGQFTDAGMTDPEVGRRTFEAVLHRSPERHEFARLLERRLHHLHETVAESKDYRVLPGVEELSFGGYGSDSTDRAELTRTALTRAGLVYGETVDADQAIVVGDTPHDVDAAHAAGMACVGVGSHHFTADQLRDAGADYAIASLENGLPV